MSIPWSHFLEEGYLTYTCREDYRGFSLDDFLATLPIPQRPKCVDFLIESEIAEEASCFQNATGSCPVKMRYLIEIKDFRPIPSHCVPNKAQIQKLHETLDGKVRGALAVFEGNYAAYVDPDDQAELHFPRLPHTLRCVVHIELPKFRHPAFPSSYPVNAFQQFKAKIVAIDPNPLLISLKTAPLQELPWSVSSSFS